MNLQITILLPDRNRKSFFDGSDLESGKYEFICSKCSNPVIINCFAIYTGLWSPDLSEDRRKEVERFILTKSEQELSIEQRKTSITKHYCSHCGFPYIALAELDEYMNSVYKITMQGIVGCW